MRGNLHRLIFLLASLALGTGYKRVRRDHGSSQSSRVMYKGQMIDIGGSRTATSRSATRTARSVVSNLYDNLILSQDVEQIDLTILLDSSLSLGQQNYDNAKLFLSNLVKMMPRNDFRTSRIRTSMYTFSVSVNLTQEFKFDDIRYRELVARQISNVQYHNASYTHLSLALYWTDRIMQHTCRTNARKIVVVATDGRSNDDSGIDGRGLTGPISDLRAHGVEVFVLALGTTPDLTKLAVLASEPDSDHIFHLRDFSSTVSILENILNRLRSPHV